MSAAFDPTMKALRLLLFCVLLLCPCIAPAQTVDCYNSTRAQGVSLMQQGHYAEAIQVFQSAQSCPDKPANDDLKEKISECRRKIQEIEAARQQRAAEERRRADEQRRQEENRRRENEIAAKAYMDITGILFKNEDYNRKEISTYGKPLYVGGIKYITPKVAYTGLSSEEKKVELFTKIYDPDQKLMAGTSSPEGYTTKTSCTIRPGKQEVVLGGWGNNTGGTYYKVGRHRYEIWYEGRMLYSSEFTVEENPAANQLRVGGMTLQGWKTFQTFYSALFSPSENTVDIIVKTDASTWFVSALPSWCSIENVTSEGFRLRCEENPNTQYRLGIIKILAGNKEVKLAAIQMSDNRAELAVGRWVYWVHNSLNESEADKYYTRGDAYRGQIKDNKPNGLGLYRDYEGTLYFGHFDDGKRTIGKGIYITPPTKHVANCPGCIYYVGDYPEDGLEGYGRCYDKNGSLLYEGRFSDGKPVDTYPSPVKNTKRKFVFREVNYASDYAYYFGETEDGRANGTGLLFLPNRDILGCFHIFFGQFEKNEPGYGLLVEYGGKARAGVLEKKGKIEFK